MVTTEGLLVPTLNARRFGARLLPVLTDDALFERTGVRIAFTGREGGVSKPPYDALNLGHRVDDDPAAVAENRRLLLEALDAADVPVLIPHQVHGTDLVEVSSATNEAVESAQQRAVEGSDGVVVETSGVAALLGFADCVPVIIVSPTGRFAVVHAGWRGTVAGIAGKAAQRLALLDAEELGTDAAASYNAYIGPHIHAECFEVGVEVSQQFVDRFGVGVAPDERHIDLFAALQCDLQDAGLQSARIVDAGECTLCSPDRFFSYRASNGLCGRHGALAVRLEG